MTRIEGSRGPQATGAARGRARPAEAGGFAMPSDSAQATTGPAAAAPLGALDSMLALQEADFAGVGDREARRHGQELLAELAALQKALLAGDADPPALHRLASLATTMPHATDPRLQSLVRSVALRARVELARRGLGG